MGIESSKMGCAVRNCSSGAVAPLAGQDFCLHHFIACCYERLDTIEPLLRSRSLDSPERAAARKSLQECADRAVFVCLREESLTNIERSQLLDILLLSGDLQLLLQNTISRSASTAHENTAAVCGKTARES